MFITYYRVRSSIIQFFPLNHMVSNKTNGFCLEIRFTKYSIKLILSIFNILALRLLSEYALQTTTALLSKLLHLNLNLYIDYGTLFL